MRFELRQLRYLQLAARERHFGRAATIAGITQSALSQQIKRLEDVLGTRLLNRDAHGVNLTDLGTRFLAETEGLIEQADAAELSIKLAATNATKSIQIGYSGMALKTKMSEILNRFMQRYKSIKIAPHFIHSNAERELQLIEGTLDCAFLVCPRPTPRIGWIEIGRQPVLACIPASHVLANRDIVRVKDLAGEPLVASHEEFFPGAYQLLRESWSLAGVDPNFMHRADEMTGILTLVAAGAGIGFTNEGEAGLAPPGVVVIPLIDPVLELPVVFAWRTDVNNDAVRCLRHVAEQVIGISCAMVGG